MFTLPPARWFQGFGFGLARSVHFMSFVTVSKLCDPKYAEPTG